jgi:hypothetical protein
MTALSDKTLKKYQHFYTIVAIITFIVATSISIVIITTVKTLQ